MENVKETIGKNLAELRKSKRLTQAALGERFGYSPKAVSRWERGETLPDIEMLCRICEFYEVKFEYLLQKEQPKDPQKNPNILKKDRVGRLSITLIAFLSVWILACTLFIYASTVGLISSAWMLFIWALPVSGGVLFICNRRWGNKIIGTFVNSYTSWTLILSVYLQLLVSKGHNLWLLFITGIPIQLILILLLTLKKEKQ